MNKIWVILSLICIVYGLFTGRYEELANAILALPEEAMSLTVTLIVSACFWNGIMMIMYDVGLIDIIAKALDPLLSLIMPTLKDEKAVLFLIGEGELREEIEQKIRDLELQKKVILTGRSSKPRYSVILKCLS